MAAWQTSSPGHAPLPLIARHEPMELATTLMQVVIALALVNVWILRFGKPTAWRGGDATNMREEFAVYGLPGWFMVGVGFVKLLCAALLIAGIWIPTLVQPAALVIAALMLGAIAMHLRVRDPLLRSMPALCLLVMALIVVFAAGSPAGGVPAPA